MNKQLRTLLAFSAIGITTAALPAFGSEFESLHVTVPFAFVAGKTSLPAGEYTVLETVSHAVMIRGSRGSAIVLGEAGDDAESESASLGFQRTGKGVYLRSVHTAGKSVSILRLVSDTEK